MEFLDRMSNVPPPRRASWQDLTPYQKRAHQLNKRARLPDFFDQWTV